MMPMTNGGGGQGGGGMPPMMPPPPGAGGGPAGGQPSPDDIKQTLVQLLTKAKQMADSAGIDWQQLIQQVSGAASQKPPVPPASNRPSMSAGGGKVNPTPGALTMSPNSPKSNQLY